MNILVTGGAGYIGSHICVALHRKGHRVFVLDDFSNAKKNVMDRLETITGSRIPVYEGDLRNRPLLDRVFLEQRVDTVVHAAGKKAVGESEERPLEYYDCNVGGTIALLRAMQAHGVTRLVFSSSATVYDHQNTVPYREDGALLNGTSPYGRTKRMIEQMLTDLAGADPRWSVALLRYFNPIGADESRLLGDDPNGIPNNLMPYICQTAAGRRPFLTVFGADYPTADGTCERDYIHVSDLAVGHVQAIEYIAAHSGVLTVNLGTGQPISVLQLVQAFERATGQRVPYRIGARRAGDIARYYASVEKANAVLGFRAEYGVEKMCLDAWNFSKTCDGGE